MGTEKPMEVLIVTHTHWDREWYRSFQQFRARLVDAIDSLLDLLDADPGYHFLLDGQAITVEDYLEIRPEQRPRLAAACAAGRVSIGPWYTQPDSLLPGGEAHVRNLLEGRRVAETIAPRASRIAYVPDSFGHPAQFPQLFGGFGLGPFVYWRGDGDATAAFGPVWRWQAGGGTEVTAVRLPGGYFNAGNVTGNVDAAVDRLKRFAATAPLINGKVLLMNGVDHSPPDATVGVVAGRLAAKAGWNVRRGLLEHLAEGLDASDAPVYSGELRGAVSANLLPGTYSSWMPVKLRNREAETLLLAWLEPFTVLAGAAGLADERPSLRHAWRRVIARQAHDSICGCSIDAVMRQVLCDLEDVVDFARATRSRLVERLAGAPTDRLVPFEAAQDLAVFNPSPHMRSDVVRLAIDVHPSFGGHCEGLDAHPWILAGLMQQGFTVDGVPARVVVSEDPDRLRLVSTVPPLDVEFLATDVPALGWKRVRLEPVIRVDDVCDEGTEITNGRITVRAAADGTLSFSAGDRTWSGLAAILDEGDCGDTYDFAPCPGDQGAVLETVRIERRVHANGIQALSVHAVHAVHARLSDDRTHRSNETVPMPVTITASVSPATDRVDLTVKVENPATDHRVRLVFPTGRPAVEALVATTFDVVARSTTLPAGEGWKQAPTETFPAQGWVAAGGLTVVAPGLPECSVAPDGKIRVTLLRATGCISRADHPARPEPAGPGSLTPGAQAPGILEARLALFAGVNPRAAQDAETGLCAVIAAPQPRLPEGEAMLGIEPREILLSSWKPAEDGDGSIVRVLNPTGSERDVELRFGLPVRSVEAVRLDEEPSGDTAVLDGGVVRIRVAPHGLRSVRVRI
jgi:alpha-mannosidase